MATRLTTIIVVVIVGATFIAGLIVGAQRDDASGPVDLIILNGKVYPGRGAKLQEAIAVRGNQILRVGTNREIKRLRRPQTVVLDAHGAAVVPGFNDPHVRLMEGALALGQIDLGDAMTPEAVAALVRSFADADPARGWILGRAGDPTVFALNAPVRRLLDDAAADRPVFLVSKGSGIAWANSKALKAAGVTRRTHTSRRSGVARESRTGEPTGVLKLRAIQLVSHVVPQPTDADKVESLRAAITEAHKRGLTSVQTVSRSDEELELLSGVREQGELTLRVYGSVEVSTDLTEQSLQALEAVRGAFPDDPLIKAGGIEVVCGARCEPAKLQHAVALLDKHRWQIRVRAQDEADPRKAAEAFEHAASGNPELSRGRRHRVVDVDNAGSGDLPDPLAELEQAVANFSDGQPADAGRPVPVAVVQAAVDASTSDAAYASFDEQRKGVLASGMLADIVILSNDIFEDPTERLKDATVAVTIFDGKIVYQRAESN